MGHVEAAEDIEMETETEAPRTDEAFRIGEMPGHLIRRLQQIAVAVFIEEVKESGFDLTPVQYATLTAVRQYPGIDQATLSSTIAYDRVTIGGVLDRLEQKKLVKRRFVRGDKRSKRLHLTPAGEEALQILDPIVVDVQDIILSGLDASERGPFLALLKKAADGANDKSRVPIRANPTLRGLPKGK